MKKIFSFLTLAAALLCSGNAWAELSGSGTKEDPYKPSDKTELASAISAGGEIKLTNTIDCGNSLSADLFTITKAVTIDLNGQTLSGGFNSSQQKTAFYVQEGSLTIKGNGTIDFSKVSGKGYVFKNSYGATLTIQDNPSIKAGYYYIFNGTSGTYDVQGGTYNKSVKNWIDQNKYEQIQLGGLYIVQVLSEICTVNGTPYKKIADAMLAAKQSTPYDTIFLIKDAYYDLTISEDYTFVGPHTLMFTGSMNYIQAGTFDCSVSVPYGIYGGVFHANVGGALTNKIQGGIFSVNPSTNLANGYAVANKNDMYCVAFPRDIKDNTTLIGGNYYSDVTNFKDAGCSVLTATAFPKYFVVPDTNIINSKVYRGAYTAKIHFSILADYYSCSSVVKDGNNNDYYVVGKNIAVYSKKIVGGTFDFNPTAYVNTTMCKVENNDGIYTVSVKPGEGTYSIGDYEYISLKDAIAVVPTDGTETIIMVKKVATESSYSTIVANQNIVLDLNNKSISNTGGHLLYNYGALKVKDSSNEKQGYLLSSNMTIKGYTGSTTIIDSCTIIGQGNGTADGGVTIDAGASLTVNGGVLKSPSAGRRALSSSGTTVINNGEIICESTSSSNKILSTAIRIANGTTTINNATITSTSTSYATLLISGGTVTIKNATVSGASATYATSITGGNTTINNITVSGNMTGTNWKAKGGTFSVNPKNSNPYCCMKGYAVTETITGEQWKIEPKTCLIQGSESEYGSVLVNGKSSDQVKAGYTVNISVNMTNPDYKVSYYLVNDSIIEGNSFEVDDNAEVTAEFVPKVYVCQIGTDGAKFETLYEASQAVLANQTINLLKDYTTANDGDYINIGKENVVVDLKGYTITLPNQSQLTVDGRPTLKNGTISGSHNYPIKTRVYNPTSQSTVQSTPTFEDLTMNGGFNLLYTEATFINCDIDASQKDYYAIVTNGSNYACKAVVKSGKYLGKSEALGTLNGGTFAISGGSYNSEPNTSWLASGFSAVESGEATYSYIVIPNYTRELTSTNMGTICIAYDVKDLTNAGATFYKTAYRIGDSKIYFDEVDQLEAGKAYIFEPTESTISLRMSGAKAAEPIAENGLYGTFDGINTDGQSGSYLTGKYIVSNNQIRLCGTGCYLNTNRAYIDLNEVDNTESTPAPGRKRIVLGNTQASTPTELENVNANVNANGKMIIDGKLVIIRDGKMFNAQGAQL